MRKLIITTVTGVGFGIAGFIGFSAINPSFLKANNTFIGVKAEVWKSTDSGIKKCCRIEDDGTCTAGVADC